MAGIVGQLPRFRGRTPWLPRGRLVLGSMSAFVATRATASVLFFGIDATDALAWGGAIAVSIAVGVAAHLVPALRAVGVAPSVALRSE